MKGVIYKCLEDMIVSGHGKEKWIEILNQAKFDIHSNVMSLSDVDDGEMMELVSATCDVLGISMEQASDAFGDHWCNVYAARIYKVYFDKHKESRSFLLALDDIHVAMTKKVANAHPPRFTYEWEDDNTLIMNYSSERSLAILVVGLAKGVGKYYKENLDVSLLDDNRVKVVFLN